MKATRPTDTRRRRRNALHYVNADGKRCTQGDAVLGSGCFGTTYRMRNAIDTQLRAVKDVGHVAPREAQMLSRLPPHENVVTYFGSHSAPDGSMRIVMALVGNGTTVSPARDYAHRRTVVGSVARALAHIHGHGLIHRDVKCSNIFVTAPLPEGRVVLGDFGHATTVAPTGHYAPTVPCGRGHWVYRSPEILDGRPYGAPADAWALGVVMFELVTATDADACVGNRPANVYLRDMGSWLRTAEGAETLEDVAEDTRAPDGVPIVALRLLAHDPDARATPAAVAEACVPRPLPPRPDTA